ncbi:MAG: hypothetical protein CVU64_08755 [Deltaproteobacteria bacterium HGW-Deltaproteobacteria-21]|nr:MAG: hypothetical protein CVU64_08755 [Deltaproteobacteria bacterium HGW-Deltaproteobacteria-21]
MHEASLDTSELSARGRAILFHSCSESETVLTENLSSWRIVCSNIGEYLRIGAFWNTRREFLPIFFHVPLRRDDDVKRIFIPGK